MAASHHSRNEQLEEIRTKLDDYDYLRIVMCDIHGISRGKLLPARNAIKFLRKGMGAFVGLDYINPRAIELQEIKDSTKIEVIKSGGNLVFDPVLDSFRSAPWAGHDKYKVAEVISEMRWTDQSPDITCPRFIARKQLNRLTEMGYSLLSGIEMEVKIFNAKDNTPIFPGEDFYSTLLISEHMELFARTEKRLKEGGVNLEDVHVEPSPGQFEINYQPVWGILGGDWPFLIREALKETALEFDYIANFMGMPTPNEGGTGAHFNHSVWDKNGKKNIFYDPTKKDNVSDFARHWTAGLLKNMNAITAFFCPTVNCYRRMHAVWGPSVEAWGIDDRYSSFRIKNFGPTSTYVENRTPSGLANPYLVMAAVIAAGLDGVESKAELPPQRKDAPTREVINNLEEALQALEASSVMKKALGEDFIEWFCMIKRSGEIKKLVNSNMKDNNNPQAYKDENELYAKFC